MIKGAGGYTERMLIKFFFLLALAVWLGSMVFFGAAVAPSAFKVLPSRDLAGQLVQAVIDRLYFVSYVAGAVMAIALMLGRFPQWLPKLAVVAAMLVSIGLADRVVGTRMDDLRAAMGPVEEASPAQRAEFNRYHKASTFLVSLAMLGGVALVILTARQS